MKIEEILEEILITILDCGYGDLDKFLEYFKTYCLLEGKDVSSAIEDILADVESYKKGKIDINDLLYSTIYLIFNQICYEIKKKYPHLEEKIEELEENFNPFISYCDSWFNNFLDEINILSCSSKEEILEKVKDYLEKE